MLLSELEVRRSEAHSALETAREILDEARLTLDKVEGCAKDAWSKKNAALHSKTVTLANAVACGLKNSPSTAAAIARFQTRADEAAAEIRAIISSSTQVCELFEWAWDTYISARSKEIEVLQLISDLSTESTAAIEPPKLYDVRQDLRVARETRVKEHVQRRRELSLPDDPHYDPQYDDRELLERRMRRWLS